MQQPVINTDDTSEWWNPACEKEFKTPIQMKLVKPKFPHLKQQKKGQEEDMVKNGDPTIHPFWSPAFNLFNIHQIWVNMREGYLRSRNLRLEIG